MKKVLAILMLVSCFGLAANAALVEHLTFDVDGSAAAGSDAVLYRATITTGSQGVAGEALSLVNANPDNSSTYNEIGQYAVVEGFKGISGTNPRTISLWVKTPTNTDKGIFFLGWGGSDATARNRYDFGLQANSDSQLRNELNAGAIQSDTGTTITDDAWHHIVLTYDGTTTSFYVDGAAYGTSETAPNTTETWDMVIGTGVRQVFDTYNAGTVQNRWFNGLIDDVQIYDTALTADDVAFLNANPGVAMPSPVLVAPTGDAPADLTAQLEWTISQPHNATANYLYLRTTDANFADVAGNIVNGTDTASPYAPTFDYNTTYFWRVDVVVDGQTYEGPVWSFVTVPETPLIELQPVSQLVAEGDLVEFTVDGRNFGPVTWKKYVDGVNDLTIGTGLKFTISAAQLTDDGKYYASVEATAAGLDPVTSDIARLFVEQEVAHYKFDGDMTDATGNGYDAQWTSADPNTPLAYVPGIDGQAVAVDDDMIACVLPEEETWFEYSVIAWAKADAIEQTDYASVFNNNSSARDFQIGCSAAGTYRYNGYGLTAMGDITTDWVMLAVTCDSENTYVYYNGKQVNSNGDTRLDFGQFAVGVNRGGDIYYKGLVDDVRVFNYALDKDFIATAYHAFTGTATCVYPPAMDFTGPNGEPDCKVNLLDLAYFAQTWMECGLIPQGSCD